ncbi:hypothetical protein V5P93_003658 [Actinokineospora auranticolor]|uniref:Concanavalin A-like lectin/glucanase superfamily protein n=1 Tax=Actinokineospora auranticolor TaxID=155976 RepID=A0A2S6GJ50_9PSEU|nr:hypothetical protein [Actinokineospora auranticolor]PPK65220.1 hypothetical protein CLV40_11567 [Actinokineospora auranticolor]
MSPTWAVAAESDLAALAVDARVTAEVRLRPHTSVVPVVEYRSARGRYGLLLDPVGALPFLRAKPRQWVMAQNLADFPPRAFTAVFDLCPLRGDADIVLFSYAVPGDGTVLALRERLDGGLTLEVAGERVSFGKSLDYAQWQRLAVSWDATTGETLLYQDDGIARVTAEAEGRSPSPLADPIARQVVARGARLPGGGAFAVGQYQGQPGDPGLFDLGRGLRGSVAEVDLWADAAGPTRRPEWTGTPTPGAVARWRFTATGLRTQETPGAATAYLGGFGPDDLRDVRAYRVIVTWGGRAWGARTLLPVGGAHRLECASAPELLVDGRPVPLDPVDAADLGRPEVPGFRIGPLQDVAEVRLHHDGRLHRSFASARRQGDLLPDLTGHGRHLLVRS